MSILWLFLYWKQYLGFIVGKDRSAECESNVVQFIAKHMRKTKCVCLLKFGTI